ncbi:hypothetical protein A4A49_02938 [Nicotiana attenuata]|uniref:F-box domain-containing protein n=1 Tax=Nicotiana attenuata TaxID=49451 RepID=A0A314LC29_NICAT|nr:hypothetical protein A4A49_02938 [Nicotiana attenuata]
MALEYFTELLDSLFFNKRCRGDEELAEIFIDILSRLPTDSLVRFQRDCRDLRVLISSQYFTTLHLSRARPMPLLRDNNFGTNKRSKQFYMLIDNLNEEYREVRLGTLYLRRNKQLGEHPPRIVCSCQGVVLFAYHPSPYYALNPITKEEVRDSWCQYLVYVFKTRTWRKIHSPSTFNFYPCDASPAVVNGALHWIMLTDLEKKDVPPCANGIMVFKMDKEELSAMPHPGSVCNCIT